MEVTEKMREFMNDLIGERMEQVYQENDGKQYDPFNEKLELKLQKVLRKMPKKQEKVLFDYLTDTSNKCSDLNEFYYRMGLRDGLKLKEAMQAMRISNPSASISIVCELSRCIGLFPLSGISPAGEDSGSIAIWTTSCLWDVRSRVLALGAGSGI